MGYEREDFIGKPVIGIINTWSDLSPCHTHFRDARRGRQARRLAGGRLSRSSCRRCRSSESFVKPTTMLYRNFLAMEMEELLRQHPVDGAVLMGGCDKTTPGTDHGRASA